MANPKFRTNQFSYSFGQPEHLYMKVSFGASGAPTIVAGTGMGINSITRSSAGRYVIALSHPYFGLMSVESRSISSSAPAAPAMYVVSDASSNATTPAITIIYNSAGTATDPASGEVAILDICLQKSSVRY